MLSVSRIAGSEDERGLVVRDDNSCGYVFGSRMQEPHKGIRKVGAVTTGLHRHRDQCELVLGDFLAEHVKHYLCKEVFDKVLNQPGSVRISVCEG